MIVAFPFAEDLARVDRARGSCYDAGKGRGDAAMSTVRASSALVFLAVLFAGSAASAADEAALKRFEGFLVHTEYVRAEALAKQLLAGHPKSARVHSRVARLHIARGRHTQALKELDLAIDLDFKCLEARSLRAELLEYLGRHKEAVEAANAVIEFYNANARSVKAPRELVAVGLALKLMNAPRDALRVLTKAYRADRADHVANIELGRLFLLKGQVTDASGEFNTVLRAHREHPEALLGLAYSAFSVGKLEDAEKHAGAALAAAPNSAGAHDLLAAMAAIDGDFDGAKALVAKSLAVNPNSISARAILAGCHLVRGDRDAYRREEASVKKINPVCADFYTYVGRACGRKRRMRLAERMYRTAIRLKPGAYDATADLGRLLFRQAKYKEAKALLDASHGIDGFNVRTFNTLNLLDDMGTYKAFAAPPKITVRLKNDSDGMLAEYVKQHAVGALDDLCRIYKFRPKAAVTIEVLPTQRYFAARCIGLPHIGAIGVCFGNVVAFTSPRVQRGRVNWRETLRHELTHAVNLLGTDYRIPHWLTEAMAVHEQGSRRPYNWDVLLKTSVRFNRIMPIGRLTRGFTRPKTSEQRMLAYCQSEVVLDFLMARYSSAGPGEKCLPALMKAFREGKELPEAIRAVTGEPFDRWEKKCMAYIRRVADAIPVLPQITARDEKAVLDLVARHPRSSEAHCNLALLRFGQRKLARARDAAAKAVELDPKSAEAQYIMASIHMRGAANSRAAADGARRAIQADKNYAPAHYLLAKILIAQLKPKEAVIHLTKAMRAHLAWPVPYQHLAKMHRDQKRDDKAAAVLEELVRNTSNSLGPSIWLGQHYEKSRRWQDAARIADVAIGIGPFFPDPHIIAGHALWELGQEERAVVEMEVAAKCAADALKQMEIVHRRLTAGGRRQQAAVLQQRINNARTRTAENNLRLAKAYVKKGRTQDARKAALAAFDLDPNNEAIRALLERLKR